MGAEKKKESPKKAGGGYKWSSALMWAAGQFAYNWFATPELRLGPTFSAVFGAFFAGWTTSALLGRFAKWGANSGVMMILGVLIGVAVFSGAFSGLSSAIDWWHAKEVKVDWDNLQKFLLSYSVLPPIGLGLLTGLYVRAKTPRGGGKK